MYATINFYITIFILLNTIIYIFILIMENNFKLHIIFFDDFISVVLNFLLIFASKKNNEMMMVCI